jgi:hypothetical protein
MIEHKNVLISLDVIEKEFVCNITKCKGACCIEGDLGAPLEKDELEILEKIYPEVEPYLMEEGKKAIQEQGTWIKDWEDDFSTTTIDEKECAYAFYDFDQNLKCGIEQAYLDKKIDFRKPISCQLYPIRTVQLKGFEALNYDKWEICSDACVLGEELKVSVFSFLKDPLIRKFGSDWYSEAEEIIAAYKENGLEKK